MFTSVKRKLTEELAQNKRSYDEKVYKLQQLIEISKSINEDLDFNRMIQTFMYICMSQLKVLRAGLFVRKESNKQNFILHRSVAGFEISRDIDYAIPEEHDLLKHISSKPACYTYTELCQEIPNLSDLKAISSLFPYFIVPLKCKKGLTGILILAEPVEMQALAQTDRNYVMEIANLAGPAVFNAFLYEITTTDSMTKLKLKHFFTDSLQNMLNLAYKEKKNLSLLMLDIDNFKVINDTHGHHCGDLIIQTISTILLECIRQTDLAARYGGEEFVLLLADTDSHGASAIAERIRQRIEKKVFLNEGKSIHLTVSLGITSYDMLKEMSTFNLMSLAESAVLKAKKNGRNRIELV